MRRECLMFHGSAGKPTLFCLRLSKDRIQHHEVGTMTGSTLPWMKKVPCNIFQVVKFNQNAIGPARMLGGQDGVVSRRDTHVNLLNQCSMLLIKFRASIAIQ